MKGILIRHLHSAESSDDDLKINKNNLTFYCPLIVLQWDASLLCNNTCALLKDQEKVEEQDSHDFAFFLLEK